MFQRLRDMIRLRTRLAHLRRAYEFGRYGFGSYRSIEGWLAEIEAIMLFRTAHRLPPNSTIVEIGSWTGQSTLCLAKGLTRGSQIIAIDPFDGTGLADHYADFKERKGENSLYDVFIENMKSRGVLDKIHIKRGYSRDFVGQFPKIDLLFIDGDHTIQGSEFDYDHFASVVVPGGYLLIHDYRPAEKDWGPTWLIENRVLPSREYTTMGKFKTLWIGQKRSTSH